MDDVKTKIKLECSKVAGDMLFEMLNYIKSIGNPGHSFSIVVDPNFDTEKKFFYDGDGSDRIYEIEMEVGENINEKVTKKRKLAINRNEKC